ncbi:SLC13 family permease [Mycobacterium stomatepiae]|uniref:Putative transporter n=1 Tax=Mycobacterium stomatepiae TaxID=470076 RepID=A0A7I7Q1G2_9MYCO|nr:ArsB/NhaD family transporter [Mycobacterium stomatepiae]MCV7166268.1 ArsB/NhaD family transporter [Mycobacterium stomatepiae]BBY19932.1 putative transporter [Mycobacterium stomatepiae]
MSTAYAIYATTIFVVAFVLIATERLNKTLVALGGATAMFVLPVINSHEVFYSEETGVDWDVIFLLLGMMIIVSVVRQTGVFEYVAIWAAKRAKGSPLRIMVFLLLVTAVGSAFLDNVTTVLLIAPVTLLVCERLGIGPAPFLLAEAFAANIGGAATLVGDPTSMIIGTAAQLSLVSFLANMAPAVILVFCALVALVPRLFPQAFSVDAERIADVMSLDENEAIRNRRLLVQCGIVLLAVFAGFVAHKQIHMEPSLVAMTGAGILIVISRLGREFYLSSVEWETLLFFAGLFVMVGALVRTGVMDKLAHAAGNAIGNNGLVTVMAVLVLSFLISGTVDNVPYAATMTPIVAHLAASEHQLHDPTVLWWALILGTVLGGNLSALGASANVVVVGIAKRAGSPISFWDFARKGVVVTAVSLAISAGYLWVRYFLLA